MHIIFTYIIPYTCTSYTQMSCACMHWHTICTCMYNIHIHVHHIQMSYSHTSYHIFVYHVYTFCTQAHCMHAYIEMPYAYVYTSHTYTSYLPTYLSWEVATLGGRLRGNNRTGPEFKCECVRFKMTDPVWGCQGSRLLEPQYTHAHTHPPHTHQRCLSLPIVAVLTHLLQRTVESRYPVIWSTSNMPLLWPMCPLCWMDLLWGRGCNQAFPKHRWSLCLPSVRW